MLAAALGTDPKFLILNKTSVIPMAVCGHFAESVIHNFSFMKGQVEQCRGLYSSVALWNQVLGFLRTNESQE